MTIDIRLITPEYGVNYRAGYVGFTYYKTSLLARGIAYITRWARMSDVRVSHALLVTGEDKCIEADIRYGVVESSLSKYFDDPKCQIFFRKPVGLTEEIARSMAQCAADEVGTEYDIHLIAAQAAQGFVAGKIFNLLFHGAPDRLASRLLNRDDRWICSELVAYCMNQQPEYKSRGILRHPNETIDPQELFEDTVVFEEWKGKCE